MVVGVGIDLVEIERVDRMIASLGDRMFERLFSSGEAEYIRSKPLPAQHAAVRLAAKEATFKALAGNELARRISWRDVEVEGDAAAIERIIPRLGIPRDAFSAESLDAFTARYTARTGQPAITGPANEPGYPVA